MRVKVLCGIFLNHIENKGFKNIKLTLYIYTNQIIINEICQMHLSHYFLHPPIFYFFFK